MSLNFNAGHKARSFSKNPTNFDPILCHYLMKIDKAVKSRIKTDSIIFKRPV